jgi:uncharacterized protein (DUF433 family)
MAVMDLKPLTPNEAGYVVGRSKDEVNRAVDKGVIDVQVQKRGKQKTRLFGFAELRYLALESQVHEDLTPTARKKVYNAVRLLAPGAHRVSIGMLQLELRDIDQQITRRLSNLEQVKELVDASGAEPVLRGTTIPVHAIAALVRGQGEAQTLKDYPSLTAKQVQGAVEYARLYPRSGRPLPNKSLKGMLAELAQTGIWDLEENERLPESRPVP